MEKNIIKIKLKNKKVKSIIAHKLITFYDKEFSIVIYNMNMVSFLHYNRKREFRPSL